MTSKKDCIFIFNSIIRGTPVSFKDKLVPLVSDYLTEINCEKSDKIISLLVQNPQLMSHALPKVIDHYCRKYYILSLKKLLVPLEINKTQTILYYE